MRSEAEEEKESDSFVFGGRCGLTLDSPAAALPLPFSLLQLCCLTRRSGSSASGCRGESSVSN